MEKKEIKLLMLGLVGAGKRTILYKLRLTENKKPISTIGFNVETLEYKNNIYSCNYSNIRRIKKLKHQGLLTETKSACQGQTKSICCFSAGPANF